jgi:AcrR family transcriptional regulator
MAGTGRTLSAQAASGELKHSRNGLERERVAGIQRARMLAAMAEVACERGAANVTVAHVVERAGVSRRTFYELFEDREDCFLAAFDGAVARASRSACDGCDPRAKWVERIRASLLALLAFVDDEPFMGRLLVVESLGAGPRALERRQRVLAQLIAAVDAGRKQASKQTGPPPLTAEGIVGGVIAVLHSRLSEREPGRLLVLAGPLMSMIVLPYLGAAASRRELARPLPKSILHSHATSTTQLNQLHMRLTYRTIRVLTALAANPGSSNRRAADASGIADQGQISKLLARLQQLGLIENAGTGGARGAPNAWTLTSEGWQIQSMLAQQTHPWQIFAAL